MILIFVGVGARDWLRWQPLDATRAFPSSPRLSALGWAVLSMPRRLTVGMAERILAILGEGS